MTGTIKETQLGLHVELCKGRTYPIHPDFTLTENLKEGDIVMFDIKYGTYLLRCATNIIKIQ